MSEPTLSLFRKLESVVQNDPEYQALETRYRETFPDFEDAMDALTEDQKGAVHELIGICGEMYLRRLELLILETEKGSG